MSNKNLNGARIYGDIDVNSVSAITISADTIFSGGTNLQDIIDNRDNYLTGSSLSGEVQTLLMRDGTTIDQDFQAPNVVRVFDLTDFPDPIGTTIPLENKIYQLENPIVTSYNFSGTSLVGFTNSNGLSNTLTYTGTDPLYVVREQGIIFFSEQTIFSTGGGPLFDYDGQDPALTANTAVIGSVALFAGFGSLGVIKDTLTIDITDITYVGYGTGLTLNNVANVFMDRWILTNPSSFSGSVLTLDNIVNSANISSFITNPYSGESLFNISTALTFNSIIIKDCNFTSDSGGTFFAEGSLDQTNPKMVVKDNGQAFDSMTIGSMFMTGNTDATVITTQNEWVRISGTTVAGINIERFEMTDNNELTSSNLEPKKGLFTVALACASVGGNNDFEFSCWQNGAIIPNTIMLLDVGTKAKGVAFFAPVIIVNGDMFEVRMRNTGATANALIPTMQVNIQ